MTWQPYGRKHILTGAVAALVVEHAHNDEYTWSWSIWVSIAGNETPIRTGTHKGTEAGAKQAVADELRRAANNLLSDARAAAVVGESNRAQAPALEVG